MKQILENIIIHYITDRQGCKTVELVTHISSIIFKKEYDKLVCKDDSNQLLTLLEFYDSGANPNHLHNLIFECLDELIYNKSIIEIQYTLPTMPYREKSYFFPKGTIIKINN